MLSRLSGVDADVVDEHALREDGCLVGIAGPVATYGEVEEEIEGVAVDPLCVGWEICESSLDDEMVVEKKFDVVGSPLDGVEMERVVDLLAGGERVFG